MCMRKGEILKGVKFFEELSSDNEFCMHLGEAELIKYIESRNVGENTGKANLGKLIRFARKHELLSKMVPALEVINNQRNYLAHNVYALFSGLVEETILPRSDLLDSDIDIFTERAQQLTENINGLADIIVGYSRKT